VTTSTEWTSQLTRALRSARSSRGVQGSGQPADVSAPPFVGTFDGSAELPRARTRWADTLPTRVGAYTETVTSADSWASITTKFLACCNAAGVPAAYLIFDDSLNITPPPGSAPLTPPRGHGRTHPVSLCQRAWWDNPSTYSNRVRVTAGQSATQPIIRGIRLGALSTEAGEWLLHTGTQDVLLIGIRTHDRAEGDCLQRSLVKQGEFNHPDLTLVGPNVGGLALLWCTYGLDTPYKADGTWRPGMTAAVVTANGSECTIRDGRNTYIGGNTDQGVFVGWCGTGPFVLENNDWTDPGGIPWFYGGAVRGAYYDLDGEGGNPPVINATPWRPSDFWVRYNKITRSTGFSPFATTPTRDSANAVCPHRFKNLGETKHGDRWLIERNHITNDNDNASGQNAMVVIKSTNQANDGAGLFGTPGGDGARDVVIRNNVFITAWKTTISLNPLRDDTIGAGCWSDPMNRLEVHDNLCIQDRAITGYTGAPDYIVFQILGWQLATGSQVADVEDNHYRRNTILRHGTGAQALVQIVADDVTTRQTHRWSWESNAIGGTGDFDYQVSATSQPPGGFGLDVIADRGTSSPIWFTEQVIGVNARINCVNLGDPPSPAQLTYASLTAAGLSRVSADEWAQDVGSPLRTAGPSASRVGCDVTELMANTRALALSGVQPS
jgi:hypothetical protein